MGCPQTAFMYFVLFLNQTAIIFPHSSN